MGNLAGTITAEPATGAVGMLAEMLADVMKVEQVPVDSHFFDDLGADSLVMAKFCARVRKREDLPSVAIKDIYAHPTIRSLAESFGLAEVEAEAEVDLDAIATLIRPRDPILVRPAAPASTRQYIVCGALQLLFFLGYAWAVAIVGARAYEWISAGKGLTDIYLGSVVFGGVGFIVVCTLPILAKWVLIGRWKPAADPHLEPGLRPLLDRQDAGPVEPAGLPDRRFAAVRALPEGAGRQDRAGHGDLLPACAGVHRPAHHRPGHGDPQGGVLRLLPGARRLDPDRSGHPRPERFHRREDRARHQHLDGRRVAARSRLLTAQRPAGTDRRALARFSGPAHERELPEGLVQAAAARSAGSGSAPSPCSSCSSCTCRWSRGACSCCSPRCRSSATCWTRARTRSARRRSTSTRLSHLAGAVLRRGARRPARGGHAAPPAQPVRQAVSWSIRCSGSTTGSTGRSCG